MLKKNLKGGHTPSFPVELQNERLRGFKRSFKAKEHVSGLLDRSFLQEGFPDGITIHSGPGFKAWRPNNYRLRIPAIKGSIGSLNRHHPTIPLFPVESVGKGVKTLKVSDNVKLQLGPNCVVAIYSLRRGLQKLWFKVPDDCFDEWLDQKVRDIEVMLLDCVRKLDLPLDYGSRVWIRHEDDIHGDEFIDGLPQELFLNDTYFKKVYPKGVEFKSPAYLKNYISNRSLEKFSPEIVIALERILDRLPEPIESFKVLRYGMIAPKDDASWRLYFRQNAAWLGLDYSGVDI